MRLGVKTIGKLSDLRSKYPIPVFYSTNVYAKFWINETFCDHTHFVWCSEAFDGLREKITGAPDAPPSSCPLRIYRDLLAAVRGRDGGSAKIKAQRNTLSTLAVEWFAAGRIEAHERKQILAYINESGRFDIWRPVIYVIPQSVVSKSRVQVVDSRKWAGDMPEYIIKNLKRGEFDLLEPTEWSS